jgi:hypothetical protein
MRWLLLLLPLIGLGVALDSARLKSAPVSGGYLAIVIGCCGLLAAAQKRRRNVTPGA